MGGARSNPGAEYRVLVVEDSGTVRRLIARILLRAGFAVTEAVDGLDAVVRCALDRPDVIVLDLEMARCGGMDALIQEHDLGVAQGGVAFARRELRTRSSTDELTGLPNRRGIQPLLSGLILPATTSFGLLMADIDHFKAVNDEWGHAAGDEVLQAVADRLRRAWPLFTVARWGGEEFLAVGPVLGPDELVEVAERFRLAVAATPVTLAGGGTLAVTVSIGAALVDRDGPESASPAAADEALYRAKEAGRNRVMVSGADTGALPPR